MKDELMALAAAGTDGEINRPLVAALASHGLLGRVFAADAVSARTLCELREELATFCTEAETALALQGLGGYPIVLFGRPAVKAEWVPKIASGSAVAAFALTEPEAGSDVASLSLRASRVDGGYRLTGEKAFISNAPGADILSVFARTSDTGAKGITGFAVPGSSPGLTGSPISLISPHPIGRFHFDDVFVPDSHVLGEVDQGMGVAMRTLNLFRPSVGAFAVGMAQAALDAAVAHVAERKAFGKRLKDFQGVTHQLADVATSVQAARLLVRDAATAYDEGSSEVAAKAAMAKLFATEAAQRAVDVAVQVHGARALERGHLLEHLYREVRAPRIYEGASEIQREIIARNLFRP